MLPLDFGTLADTDTLWEREWHPLTLQFFLLPSLSHSSYLYFMLKDKTSKTWYSADNEKIWIIMKERLLSPTMIIINNGSYNISDKLVGMQSKTFIDNKTALNTLYVRGFCMFVWDSLYLYNNINIITCINDYKFWTTWFN